jgi:hypothetical protein
LNLIYNLGSVRSSEKQELPRRCGICTGAQWKRFGSGVGEGGGAGFGALAPGMRLGVAKEQKNMLWTICVVLLVLWALGMATAYTASGLIHVLLAIALVVMVVRLMQGRRIV